MSRTTAVHSDEAVYRQHARAKFWQRASKLYDVGGMPELYVGTNRAKLTIVAAGCFAW
jgi:hypothetical protein